MARTGMLEGERRARSDGGLDPDATAVHLHNPLGDRQTQSSSAFGLRRRAVALLELFEYLLPIFLAYPRARVGDRCYWNIPSRFVTVRRLRHIRKLIALPTRFSNT